MSRVVRCVGGKGVCMNYKVFGVLISLFILFMIARAGGMMPESSGFVTYDKTNPLKFLDQHGKELVVRGINRFAVYEKEDNRDDMTPDEYFDFLKVNGYNLIRVFVREGYVIEGNRPKRDPLEPELGTYSKQHLEELDLVFKLANKYKIYIILCMFDHYYLRYSWGPDLPGNSYIKVEKYTPYYEVGTSSDRFYTSKRNREYQIKRVKMLAERYKDEKYLFAWDPMNEFNGVLENSYTSEKQIVVDWFEAMAKAIREVDKNHMITISLTGDVYWSNGKYMPWTKLYSSKYTDIIQVHCYGYEKDPDNYLEQKYRTYIREAKKFNRPVMVGEFSVKLLQANREELIRRSFEIAKEEGVPALFWTHRFDPFGELDDVTIETFKDVFGEAP